MFILLLVALNIASVLICHYVAKSRGAKPVKWGVLGALFGPLAIPFVFSAKPALQ